MIYKIGMSKYQNGNSDKNCGLFESELIKDQLRKIKTKNKLIIINGMMDEWDKESLDFIMNNYDKNQMIFILTDLSLLENNLDIIKKCGILLHSSKNENFGKDLCKNSFYSFVPDLYYDENRIRCNIKSNIIVFGGSFGSTILKDESITDYVCDEDGKVYDNILFMFKGYRNDYRISYDEYRKVLDLSKYILCIKRESFIQDAWVTPRLLDGLSSFCFPLVDKNYDVEYDYPKEYLCSSYVDVVNLMNYFSSHEKEMNEIIEKLRSEALKRKENFSKLIKSL